MQRKVEKQNLPFLDDRNIFAVLFRQKKLPELAPLRQTCRIANQQFNHALFENPAGMLQKLDQLTPAQLHKFLTSNAAHADTLLPLVDRFDAAYASYTLLGDISKLDPSRLPGVLKYMQAQKVSPLLIDCVEMIHSIYNRPAKNLDLKHIRIVSPNYYCDSFSNCLDRMARNYLDDRNLGNLRLLFLYLLFRTTRAREQLPTYSKYSNYAYEAAKEFLSIAYEHALFAKHSNPLGERYMLRMIMQAPGTTPSQDLIAAEIDSLTRRLRDRTAEVSNGKLMHHGRQP